MMRHVSQRTGAALICLLLSLCAPAQQTEAGSSRLLLPVKQGRLWGYADTSKRIIIAPQFDVANPFEGKVAVVEKNRKAYAIDTSGKILTPGFDQLLLVEDSVLSIYLNMVSDSLGGWGLSTLAGQQLLPPAYDEVLSIGPGLYAFRKDTLWGALSKNGALFIPPEYDTVQLYRGNFILLKKGKKVGLAGSNGKSYLPVEYASVYIPCRNVIGAFREGRKEERGWGAIDLTPQQFIPFGFDSLFRISEYFVGVTEGDSAGCYFPLGGGNPTQTCYKSFVPLDLYWVKPVDFSGNCGLMDTLGRMLVPVAYADVCAGGNGCWFVSDKNKKWGIYSPDGRLLAEPLYTRILPFRGNVTVLFDGTMQGLINNKGEVLIPPGNQEILVRGNTVKVLRPDNSATLYTIDASGRIADRNSYDEFHVIRIGGNSTNGSLAQSPLVGGSSGSRYTPRIDSLQWFFDAGRQLWGLWNTFTGDTVLRPQFHFVQPQGENCTLVGIRAPIDLMAIDGQTAVGTQRVGLVNDTTGKFILHPVYAAIYTIDLGDHGFRGCVRATLQGGQMALVSTDGQERVTAYTWIDHVQNGYARVCSGGQWTLNDPGEHIAPLNNFSREQALDNFRSFGKAAYSKPFMEKRICIAGGKWGYLDSTGVVVIAATYEGARPSAGRTGIVKQGKKWGLIDMSGANRIPCVYDALSYLQDGSHTIVIAQNNSMRYGYIDRNGNILIPADLKQSKPLGKGFIAFSRTGKWGVMNTKGETVCPETYHEILPFSEGRAAVRLGNRWGYIDTSGTEVLPPKYQKAGPFREGMARVVINQRWGFIDAQGEVLIEAKFLQAGDFSGYSAPVKTRDGWGLVNRDGKWVQKPEWYSIRPLDSLLRGLFVVRNEYLFGLCRSDGKLLVAPRYEGYRYLGEQRIAYRSGTSWGLMDTTGRTVTLTVFELIKTFSENLAPALQGGLWGFIDPNGRYRIYPQFRVAAPFSDHRAYVISESSAMFIDTGGRTVLRMPSQMTLIGYSEGKYLAGRLNDKREMKSMFFLTRHGVRVNRLEYKEALPFSEGAARVRPGGTMWGLISYTGYYLVKPRFFQLGPFENGLARFQMRYTQGAFSLEGKPLLPVAYDSIQLDEQLGMVRFEKGNAVGWLFPDGRICWPETE